MQDSKIRVVQLFDDFNNFYQPYIPPMLERLKTVEGLDIRVIAFKGNNEKNLIIFPSYYKRKILEKLHSWKNPNKIKLSYEHIYFFKKKFDIVHIQHSYLFPKIVTLLNISATHRPKVVITLRGGDTYVKPWISKRWENFYRTYGNKVDAFIVMSNDQKEYLSRWGVPSENIYVIPISFREKSAIEPKGPNPRILKLVSVFRMCWEKNISDCLRFVKTLKQNNIPFVYDIFGGGPDLGQLFYLRDKYGLNDVVNIQGKLDNEILTKKLNEYDFLLQLSYSESLGMSVIEAQSFGTPAIVSNNGGLPEIIKDVNNGFVVDLEDFRIDVQKIISVWKNEAEYLKLSRNAIQLAQQNYCIEKEVQNLLNLYEALK